MIRSKATYGHSRSDVSISNKCYQCESDRALCTLTVRVRWEAQALPSFLPVYCNCLQLKQKWQMVCAGIQNICAARLLVARPQRPACLHQALLNCRSKYTALIGMACSCYSEKGRSSAAPLMCPPLCPKPFSLLSVYHLDFAILDGEFLK